MITDENKNTKKIKFRPLGVPLFRWVPRDWTLFPEKIMAYYFKVLIIIRTFASLTRSDASVGGGSVNLK